jgi:type I restriction enzyme S subunit
VCIEAQLPFEIPNSWEWARISSIGYMVRGKGIKRTEIVDHGFPCIRYGEIYTSYNISFTDALSHVEESIYKSCNHISNGDIVMTLTGENKPDIAKAIVYLGDGNIAAGGDLAYWTRHGMSPLYLVFFMASPFCIEQKRRTEKNCFEQKNAINNFEKKNMLKIVF